MLQQDVCDRAVEVLPHEEGLVLTLPGGASFALTLRAAEETGARLLAAARRERSGFES